MAVDKAPDGELTSKPIKLSEIVDLENYSRRFQLLEPLNVVDSPTKTPCTIPTGEIVRIVYRIGDTYRIVYRKDDFICMAECSPDLEIIAREIVPFYQNEGPEKQEKALGSLQEVLNLTRDDLLFVLATLTPNYDHHHGAAHDREQMRLAELFGSDRDPEPLQSVRAIRALVNEGSALFYKKFGTARSGKALNVNINGKDVGVTISGGSHGSWWVEIYVDVEGKDVSMEWRAETDGQFSPSVGHSGGEFLTQYFGKKSSEAFFLELMEKLPGQE